MPQINFEDQSQNVFYSDEVQDIMGRQPSWITKWGITILIFIFISIIICCWFIKYPQTILASVVLTSETPTADLNAKATGIIDSVFVSDNEIVSKGQLIALIANSANYDDIVILEKILDKISGKHEVDRKASLDRISLLTSVNLGSFQPALIDFMNACMNYNNYFYVDQIGQKKALIKEQIEKYRIYIKKLYIQRYSFLKELEYEKKNIERDSILFIRELISTSEFESSVKNYIAKRIAFESFDANLEREQLNVIQLEQQLIEFNVKRELEVLEYERQIYSLESQLRSNISLWKEKFTVIAPYDGQVSLQNIWGRGQSISNGDLIASVFPFGEMKIIGRLKVPSSGFGKVKIGQEVNIKLNGFPYMEFGILKGVVSSISAIPENTENGLYYTVDVELPCGLCSNYNQKLPFVQNMNGTAEIITENLRLLEQLFLPIRSLLVNK